MGYSESSREMDYAFDGMYLNVDSIIGSDGEEAVKALDTARLDALREKHNKLIRSVSGVATNEGVREKSIRMLLKFSEDFMVARYAKTENLSYEYIVVAKETQGLKLIIYSFFSGIGNIRLDNQLSNTVESFAERIYRNTAEKIVYYRVQDVQVFLHRCVERVHGPDAVANLPVEGMRKMLSACRLHLSLFDQREKSLSYNITQMKASADAYQGEMRREYVAVLQPTGKTHMSRWKARHMKTLMYFNAPETRECYKRLYELDVLLERNKYIERVSVIVDEFIPMLELVAEDDNDDLVIW